MKSQGEVTSTRHTEPPLNETYTPQQLEIEAPLRGSSQTAEKRPDDRHLVVTQRDTPAHSILTFLCAVDGNHLFLKFQSFYLNGLFLGNN